MSNTQPDDGSRMRRLVSDMKQLVQEIEASGLDLLEDSDATTRNVWDDADLLVASLRRILAPMINRILVAVGDGELPMSDAELILGKCSDFINTGKLPPEAEPYRSPISDKELGHAHALLYFQALCVRLAKGEDVGGWEYPEEPGLSSNTDSTGQASVDDEFT